MTSTMKSTTADESLVLAEAGPHQTGFHGDRPLPNAIVRATRAPVERRRTKTASPTSTAASCATTSTARIEEDVWRRDFTANALYYNIEDFSIWDYVGGVPRHRRARVLR